MLYRIFTSEAPAEGHPDKVCDAISDAVLDAYLASDATSHVACESFATTDHAFVMGEITSSANVDVGKIVRNTITDIGYDAEKKYFDGNSCKVDILLHQQSPDINMGVVNSAENRSGSNDAYNVIGAGDQGMMFGFACRETAEYMPAPIQYSKNLMRRLSEVRKNGTLPFIFPDGKTQVTLRYGDNGPESFESVVLSAQHSPDFSIETVREGIMEEVIKKVLPQNLITKDTKFYINPTGRFVVGGPAGDTGLTGRKIIADTYGGYTKHGGGAFSGKDPTKVDRSAALMARYAAKNIVAAGLADYCEIAVAYAIGLANPLMLTANTFGTGKLDDDKLSAVLPNFFDFRPAAIIDKLSLLRPVYRKTSSFGPFGTEDPDFTWERLDKADALKQII